MFEESIKIPDRLRQSEEDMRMLREIISSLVQHTKLLEDQLKTKISLNQRAKIRNYIDKKFRKNRITLRTNYAHEVIKIYLKKEWMKNYYFELNKDD